MKLRKLLNEIGDTAKIFPYSKSNITNLKNKKLPDEAECRIVFVTDKKTKYVVNLNFIKDNTDGRYVMTAEFRINNQDYGYQSNKFEIFSVMSTIVDMLVNALKINDNLISTISFEPTKTDDDESWDNSAAESQRGKLYIQFIKKAFDRNEIKYKILGNYETVQFKII